MIFSEIYGSYYKVMSEIIREALKNGGNVSVSDMRKIIDRYAFYESVLSIGPAITEERWQIITKDGRTPVRNEPTRPMSDLERRWLKAISLDPRIRLFDVSFDRLGDTEPLFTPDDYYVFDKYEDGDPYEDEGYIKNFRLILDAVKEGYPLRVGIQNRKGMDTSLILFPKYLEYSEKDDKFRLISYGHSHQITINLARIRFLRRFNGEVRNRSENRQETGRTVTILLKDERNALERVLLHFSHFKKQAEKIGDDIYRLIIDYDAEDETEMVIRLLSFGPMVKVEGPDRFTELIKERLIRQKGCGL